MEVDVAVQEPGAWVVTLRKTLALLWHEGARD